MVCFYKSLDAVGTKIIVMVWVIALGACTDSRFQQPTPEQIMENKRPTGTPIEITSDMKKKAREGLLKSLKDPTSAQFGEMFAAKTESGETMICGYINAKNSYGGYNGNAPFAGVLKNGAFIVGGVGGGTCSSDLGVYTVCGKAGIFVEERDLSWRNISICR